MQQTNGDLANLFLLRILTDSELRYITMQKTSPISDIRIIHSLKEILQIRLPEWFMLPAPPSSESASRLIRVVGAVPLLL